MKTSTLIYRLLNTSWFNAILFFLLPFLIIRIISYYDIRDLEKGQQPHAGRDFTVVVFNKKDDKFNFINLLEPSKNTSNQNTFLASKPEGVKYCVKVHQFYIRIWCKNAPLKFLCSLLNSPTLAEQNLDAMHGNHIKNQKALSS